MAAQTLTVLEVIQSSAGYLGKHGVEQPRLNAEHLLAHVLEKGRMDLYLEFDRPVGPRELEPMRELIRRRGKGAPLQHLLGTVQFHGRTFKSDARALVPRPETERLVEIILKEVLPGPHEAPLALLDVGTGSGVIALTLAAERPIDRIVGLDLSAEALALARENAADMGQGERVEWVESDLFAHAPPGPYDVIAANLPYIPSGEIAALSREVRHDPALALDGGADGLAIIARCVSDAREHLRPGGCIALEIGHNQAALATGLLSENGYRNIRAEKDYQGIDRFLFAAYGS